MRFFATLAIIAALACGGCAHSDPAPVAHHKRGALTTSAGSVASWGPPLATVTGNNATVTVFDTTASSVYRNVERVTISCFFDQAVTVLYQVRHAGSSTWRTMNGNGAGDAVTASTGTVIDYLILGYDSRIQVVTGGTGPSTSELDIGLVYARPLAI